jgi:predicted RNA-binding Zn ribbon-like protein
MPRTKTQPHKQRSKQGKRADFPRLLGGNLCLDFVNTIEGRLDPHPIEFLHSYEDVVHWGEHVSMLKPKQAATLIEVAKESPEIAAFEFEMAIELREALYRIFLAQAHEAQPPQTDIERLKGIYIEALNHAQLVQTPHGYAWHWPIDEIMREALLWPITKSAVDLLCSSDLQRIKECPGADDCGWLFFDASENRSRRWCSMEGCGSRVKMRHQYARKRKLQFGGR